MLVIAANPLRSLTRRTAMTACVAMLAAPAPAHAASAIPSVASQTTAAVSPAAASTTSELPASAASAVPTPKAASSPPASAVEQTASDVKVSNVKASARPVEDTVAAAEHTVAAASASALTAPRAVAGTVERTVDGPATGVVQTVERTVESSAAAGVQTIEQATSTVAVPAATLAGRRLLGARPAGQPRTGAVVADDRPGASASVASAPNLGQRTARSEPTTACACSAPDFVPSNDRAGAAPGLPTSSRTGLAALSLPALAQSWSTSWLAGSARPTRAQTSASNAAPAPAKDGGSSPATGSPAGVAMSAVLALIGLWAIAIPRATRRLRLASTPRRRAPFLLASDRPG